MTTPGYLNDTPLITACAHQILDDWRAGSRDAYHMMRARQQVESTLEVLRRRGLLNDAGIALCRDEIGDLK